MENKKRLIDADAMMQDIKADHDRIMQDPEISSRIKWYEAVHYGRIHKLIRTAPTVDAVAVVHGRWIPEFERDETYGSRFLHSYRCSACKGQFGWQYTSSYNYCPNCGAKMDERMQDNES